MRRTIQVALLLILISLPQTPVLSWEPNAPSAGICVVLPNPLLARSKCLIHALAVRSDATNTSIACVNS